VLVTASRPSGSCDRGSYPDQSAAVRAPDHALPLPSAHTQNSGLPRLLSSVKVRSRWPVLARTTHPTLQRITGVRYRRVIKGTRSGNSSSPYARQTAAWPHLCLAGLTACIHSFHSSNESLIRAYQAGNCKIKLPKTSCSHLILFGSVHDCQRPRPLTPPQIGSCRVVEISCDGR